MVNIWDLTPGKQNSKSKFKKESIKSKKLSKWGDADMDGTPNFLDCDPREVSKDAYRSYGSIKRPGSYTRVSRPSGVISRPSRSSSTRSSPSPSPTYSRSYLERQIAIRQAGGTGDRPAGGFAAAYGGGGGGGGISAPDPGITPAQRIKIDEAAEKVRLQSVIAATQKRISAGTYVSPTTARASFSTLLERRTKASQKATAVQAHIAQQLEQRAVELKSFQAAQKSIEIQRAKAQAAIEKARSPPLTAKQKALLRSTGFLALAQSAQARRMAQSEKFKSLKQRRFEKKYPGYYYNTSYF